MTSESIMNFIKQQAAGFYLNTLALVAALVATVFYFVNCNTSYFLSSGTNAGVIACSIAAIALEAVILGANQTRAVAGGWTRVVLDVCCVAASVTLMCAFTYFLSDRINAIASIATFNQNAQNMADLMSAFYSLAAYLVAIVLSVVASYCKVAKRNA